MGARVAFVVSRWHINCCSAKGKEFLLKRSHKAEGLVGAGGGRRPQELKNKLKGKFDNWKTYCILHRDTQCTESITYILFVTEVDSLQRLPGYTFNKVLRDTVRTKRQKELKKICRLNGQVTRLWGSASDLGNNSLTKNPQHRVHLLKTPWAGWVKSSCGVNEELTWSTKAIIEFFLYLSATLRF